MNAERLHAIARIVQDELTSTNLITRLQTVVNSLQSIVNQPQTPQHQQQLGQNLNDIYKVLEKTESDNLTPAWKELLEEMGGSDILGKNLQKRLESIFSRNQITYSLALEETKILLEQLNKLKMGLQQTIQGLTILKVGIEELKPGECEIGILIPRQAVGNDFGRFAKELNELNYILNTFSEVATGKPGEFGIRTLSSSELLVFLKSAPKIGLIIVSAVAKLLECYKNLVEIRKYREELKKQNVPAEKLSGIDEHADGVINTAVEQITIEIMQQCDKNLVDQGRRNELNTSIRVSLKKVVARIDQGYNVEVRVAPLPKPSDETTSTPDDAETRKHIENIQKTKLNYMKLEGTPILKLSEGPKLGNIN